MRRGFGGRQPLCGTGVVSLIERTLSPFAFKLRRALSRPFPTPFTNTWTSLSPPSFNFSASFLTTTPAAYGVDFFGPLNPQCPALAHARALPCKSVAVINVLLYVE